MSAAKSGVYLKRVVKKPPTTHTFPARTAQHWAPVHSSSATTVWVAYPSLFSQSDVDPDDAMQPGQFLVF